MTSTRQVKNRPLSTVLSYTPGRRWRTSKAPRSCAHSQMRTSLFPHSIAGFTKTMGVLVSIIGSTSSIIVATAFILGPAVVKNLPPGHLDVRLTSSRPSLSGCRSRQVSLIPAGMCTPLIGSDRIGSISAPTSHTVRGGENGAAASRGSRSGLTRRNI